MTITKPTTKMNRLISPPFGNEFFDPRPFDVHDFGWRLFYDQPVFVNEAIINSIEI